MIETKPIFAVCAAVLFCLQVDAQEVLYSTGSGSWNSGSTWATEPGGAPCGCTPTVGSSATILPNHHLEIAANASVGDLHISEESRLVWTQADVALSVAGDVDLASTAQISSDNHLEANLHVLSIGVHHFNIEGRNQSLKVYNFVVGEGSTVAFSGDGFITVENDLVLSESARITTPQQSVVTVRGSLRMLGPNSGVSNQGQFHIENDFLLLGAGQSFISNDGTLSVGGDISLSWSDQVVFQNNPDALMSILGDDLELNNNCNKVVFHNYGNVWVVDDLKESPPGINAARFYNYSGALLQLGHTSSDLSWRLYADYENNTVEYNANVHQDFLFDPVDAYWNLVLSGAGRKRSTGNLDINGDLRISSNAQLDVEYNNDDIVIDGNWINTSIHQDAFVEGLQLVTFFGENDQLLLCKGGEEFNRIVVNKDAGNLVLLDPVVVQQSGEIEFLAGVVQTTPATPLIVEKGATANSGTATSYVDGPFVKRGSEAFVFATGNGQVWAPVELIPQANAADGDEFVAQYHYSSAPNPDKVSAELHNASHQEYWSIDQTRGNTAAAIALHWKDADRSIITELSNVVVAHWNAAKALWEMKGQQHGAGSAIGSDASGSVRGTAQGEFGLFSFGFQNTGVLPVELIDFRATPVNNVVELNWQTASEINNDRFEVQRIAAVNYNWRKPQDGFETIVSVAGAGTTSSTIDYAAIDSKPLHGTSYYRLVQVDFDGTRTYSDLAVVEVESSPATDLSVYPSPAAMGEAIVLQANSFRGDEPVRVRLTNSAGQTAFDGNVSGSQLSLGFQMVLPSELPSGVYFVTATQHEAQVVSRLAVQ